MGNIQHYNALLYEKHKGLVDDLASEGRALRRELVESCKAFAEAMPETVTDELRKEAFDLFMRDVHIAHDEFQKRLGSLCDNQHASELERLNTENKELNNRIAELNAELEKQEKDSKSLSKRLNGNILDLCVKLQKQEKDNISLSKKADELKNENSKNAKKLEEFTKLREDINKTVKSFDDTLKKIDRIIERLIYNVIESSSIFSSSNVKEEAKKFHEVSKILEDYWKEHLLKYRR